MFEFSNEDIIYVKGKEIEYIKFKILEKYNVKNCYTLKGENIDFSFNSEFEKASYSKISNELGICEKNLVKPIQTHTDIIKCIDRVYNSEELKDVDGLITDKKDIALTSKNADCILFLFYDPVKKVIANVHSGWKGTFKKIAEKTVVKMINYYKCNPEDIICCICPSIRKCHFEVDESVKTLCEEIFGFTNRTNEFIKKGDIKDSKQKFFIDTVLINKILLYNIGLNEKNIIDSNICSVCSCEKINSYRIEGENFRRATAIISL